MQSLYKQINKEPLPTPVPVPVPVPPPSSPSSATPSAIPSAPPAPLSAIPSAPPSSPSSATPSAIPSAPPASVSLAPPATLQVNNSMSFEEQRIYNQNDIDIVQKENIYHLDMSAFVGDGAHNYNKKGNPPTGVCKGQVTSHEKKPGTFRIVNFNVHNWHAPFVE